jgi:hypothetical protein
MRMALIATEKRWNECPSLRHQMGIVMFPVDDIIMRYLDRYAHKDGVSPVA